MYLARIHCQSYEMKRAKSKRKTVLCIVMVIIMLIGTAVPVSASSNRIIFGFHKYYGNCFASANTVLYKYKAYKNLNVGTIVYTKKKLTGIMYHTKGRSGKVLSGSSENAFGWNSTISWNNAIGVSVGLARLVSLSAEKGYGSSLGWETTKRVAQTASLEENGFKNAATGYYTMVAGRPHYRIHWRKYKKSTGELVKQSSFYMPTGSTAKFIIRSLNGQRTWAVYS